MGTPGKFNRSKDTRSFQLELYANTPTLVELQFSVDLFLLVINDLNLVY